MSKELLTEFLADRSSPGELGGLPGLLRYYSTEFKRHVLEGNAQMTSEVSDKALRVIQTLALVIRGAEDNGRLPPNIFLHTGKVVTDATIPEAESMMASATLDRTHRNFESLKLRDCFNKLIHVKHVSYRIDESGSHFQLTSGPDQNLRKGPWVAEISIVSFADDCEAAIKMLANQI